MIACCWHRTPKLENFCYTPPSEMKKSVIRPKEFSHFELDTNILEIPISTSETEFYTFERCLKKKKFHKFGASSLRTTNDSTRKLTEEKSRSIIIGESNCLSSTELVTKKRHQQTQAKSVDRRIAFENKKSCKVEFGNNQIIKKSLFEKSLTSSANFSENYEQIYDQSTIIQENNKSLWCIENFKIIKKIGSGSYSSVFLAVEKHSNFLCSLKQIKKSAIKDENNFESIIRELKVHHYFNHKNIVNIYGEFHDDHSIYLIEEYCEKGDLHKYLREKLRASEEITSSEASHIIKQICEAVSEMHSNLVIHRDIKPENIFITSDNTIKLGDFGCSVACNLNRFRNTRCGTPLYFAPEIIEQRLYSETVDIWAIGVLAFEILTGESPFNIRDCKDLVKIVNEDVKFEYIEDEIARDFVEKLLQKDAKMRLEIDEVLLHPFLSESVKEN